MALGRHGIPTNLQAASPSVRIPHVRITYPAHGTKVPTSITLHDLWNRLTDESFNGNIINQISTPKTEGILPCPLMPQFFTHTVGNLELAEQRSAQRSARHDYADWIERNRPHLSENTLFGILLGN